MPLASNEKSVCEYIHYTATYVYLDKYIALQRHVISVGYRHLGIYMQCNRCTPTGYFQKALKRDKQFRICTFHTRDICVP